MSRRPTRSTRTDTPFPFPALFRAAFAEAKPLRLRAGRSTHAGPASALALVSARRGLAAGLFRLGLAALGFARSLLRRLRLLLRRLLLLLAQLVGGDIPLGDRKSTRLTPVTNAPLVFRLLLEKKKNNKK